MLNADTLRTLLITGAVCSFLAMAFISAVERGATSLSVEAIGRLRGHARKRRVLLNDLLNHPERLRGAILVYKAFFLAVFVCCAIGLVGEDNWLHAIILAAGVVAGANVLPQRITAPHAVAFISKVATPVHYFVSIVAPLLGNNKQKRTPLEAEADERKTLENLEYAIEADDTGKTSVEKDMLKSVLRFGDETAGDVMTPHADVFSLDSLTPFKEVLSRIASENYSRIPVYESSPDHITGILYVKDLLPWLEEKGDFEWQRFVRKPYFIPETKMAADLLREFQHEKVHIAVVVDEYGSMSGIVTMEDILEEIVGEINDEYDEVEPNFIALSDGRYVFEGRTPLPEFYETMNLHEEDFEDEAGDCETLAGLVLALFNEFPKLHSRTEHAGLTFEVLSTSKRRLLKIMVGRRDGKAAK